MTKTTTMTRASGITKAHEYIGEQFAHEYDISGMIDEAHLLYGTYDITRIYPGALGVLMNFHHCVGDSRRIISAAVIQDYWKSGRQYLVAYVDHDGDLSSFGYVDSDAFMSVYDDINDIMIDHRPHLFGVGELWEGETIVLLASRRMLRASTGTPFLFLDAPVSYSAAHSASVEITTGYVISRRHTGV